MLGLHRRLPVFQPPPCMCAEIEEHVREAIAMRDEMAKWDTPLREWAKLQQMPVLTVKSEPKPAPPQPVPLFDYGYAHAVYVSTSTVHGIVRAPVPAPTPFPPGSLTIFDGVPGSLALAPQEVNVRVGHILTRGNGRYQVTSIAEGRGRVRVVKLRD